MSDEHQAVQAAWPQSAHSSLSERYDGPALPLEKRRRPFRGKHTPSPFGSVAASQTFLNGVGDILVAVECLTISGVAGGEELAELNAARFCGTAHGSNLQPSPYPSPRHTHTLTGHNAIWDADPTGASILTDTSSPACTFWLRAGAGKLNRIEMLGRRHKGRATRSSGWQDSGVKI